MKASKSFFAPGKLYIAGEYAIVLRKSSALLAPLVLGITSIIRKNDKYIIRSTKHNQDFGFSVVSGKVIGLDVDFLDEAVQTAVTYLAELKKELHPFLLEITSNLDYDEKQKFGFGSSGALSVSIIGGILSYFDVSFTKEELFKLAVVSQYKNHAYSSFGDIATSSYGEWIHYHAFSQKFLEEKISLPLLELTAMRWKQLKIVPMQPRKIPYLVIWTKQEANSQHLVKEMERFYDSSEFLRFAKKTKHSVARLKRCFTKGKNKCIIRHIDHLDQLLQTLAQFSNVSLYTSYMEDVGHTIRKYEGTMKFSGAGAGDCVIAFFLDERCAQVAKQVLQEDDYVVFDNIMEGM